MKNAAKPTQPIEQRAPLVPPPMPPVVPAPAVSGPAVPEPVVAETPVSAPGPNTQALYAKQAARKAIMEETAAKLKALDEAPDAAAETLSRLGKELTDEAEG